MPLKAIALNCTLKSDPTETSSTDRMIGVLEQCLEKHDIALTETIRCAAYNIKAGVTSEEGEDDDWPELRKKILNHDILIFGGPIWMGQVSSVGKRVLERMDAFMSETDEAGRMPSYGKVAVAAIVGNEDGAHQCTAQLFQALNDVGWTIPAVGSCYWVGEAMGSTDFKDLDAIPDKVSATANMVVDNAAHLAALLAENPYEGH
tara:strand:+ start:9178 stop:9789 length:612 start_codon:yes stop_codon:yes gene_type:complete